MSHTYVVSLRAVPRRRQLCRQLAPLAPAALACLDDGGSALVALQRPPQAGRVLRRRRARRARAGVSRVAISAISMRPDRGEPLRGRRRGRDPGGEIGGTIGGRSTLGREIRQDLSGGTARSILGSEIRRQAGRVGGAAPRAGWPPAELTCRVAAHLRERGGGVRTKGYGRERGLRVGLGFVGPQPTRARSSLPAASSAQRLTSLPAAGKKSPPPPLLRSRSHCRSEGG